jgi:CRISPR/Cas system CSM-associated protein Csm3 (group 7 of RAMP superfamily)
MTATPQRLNLDYRIVWESDWHAGSGEGSAGVDRLVRRRGPGRRSDRPPLLPGSQFKGVLRHHCERLAALLGCEVVSPHQLGPAQKELLRNFRPLARSGLLIDRLFGSRYQGDCLFIDDALPEASGAWPARNHARTSIDRLSRTARDRTLFISEVVAGGEQRALVGRLRARHAPGVLTCMEGGFPYEYALLLAGLVTLDALGGDRSVGLGSCRVEVPGQVVHWNDRRDYLLAEALRGMEEEDWKGWIAEVRKEMSA